MRVLTDNDKLNIALELLYERDVEKFEKICELVEQKDKNIADAINGIME